MANAEPPSASTMTPETPEIHFPPGTARLTTETHVVLAPQPTSDPNDPLNWSALRKTIQITLLGFYAIFVWALTVVSPPLWSQMSEELGFTYPELNNSYGISAATLSIGCLIFVPLALRGGRRPIYLLTSLLQAGTNIWCARQKTLGDLYGTNVIFGAAGSVNEALFQMTVSDLFFVHQRGTVNGLLFFLGANLGGYFAPVAAGYIAVGQNWRWVFWYLAIFQFTLSILMFFFLEESQYCPNPQIEGVSVPESGASDEKGTRVTDSEKKHQDEPDVRRGSLTEAALADRSAPTRLVEIDHSIPKRSIRQRFSLYTPNSSAGYKWYHHITQPFILLFTVPAIAFAAWEYSFCLCALSLVAVSSSNLLPLEPYNFSPIGVGNMNIAPAIGNLIGTVYGGPLVDWAIVRLAKRNGGIYEPEMRLVLFPLPAVAMPLGVLLYGLSIAKGVNWAAPAVANGIIGFSIGGMGDIVLTYLQDCYPEILPDALVGVAFVRNIIAMVLVFCLSYWFEDVGIYNSFVMLGCFSVAFSLAGIPMYIWGKRFRENSEPRYRRYAERQFVMRAN